MTSPYHSSPILNKTGRPLRITYAAEADILIRIHLFLWSISSSACLSYKQPSYEDILDGEWICSCLMAQWSLHSLYLSLSTMLGSPLFIFNVLFVDWLHIWIYIPHKLIYTLICKFLMVKIPHSPYKQSLRCALWLRDLYMIPKLQCYQIQVLYIYEWPIFYLFVCICNILFVPYPRLTLKDSFLSAKLTSFRINIRL